MYVKYSWKSTATEAQVRSDIIAIITGETSTAALSASCDTANTNWIANTAPTNWTVHDATPAAGQGGFTGTSQVLRSLNTDGTTYKYAQISLSAGSLVMVGWENWNNTSTNTAVDEMYPGAVVLAHGGFNKTFGSASASLYTISYATSGSIYIFATPRYIIVTPSPLLLSVNSGQGGAAIVEFSRDTPSLDITYPVVASFSIVSGLFGNQSSGAQPFAVTRFKNPAAVGDIGTSSPVLSQPGTSMTSTQYNCYLMQYLGPQTTTSYGVGNSEYILAFPMTIVGYNANTTVNNVVFGTVQGGLLASPGYNPVCTHLDEMIIGSTTYVILKSYTSLLLVPRV